MYTCMYTCKHVFVIVASFPVVPLYSLFVVARRTSRRMGAMINATKIRREFYIRMTRTRVEFFKNLLCTT